MYHETGEKGTFYSGEKWTKQIGVDTVKRITDTLNVSRSNQYERGKTKRGRHTPQPGD